MNVKQKQTAIAVGVVLLILLAVVGFLAYRHRQASNQALAPLASGQPPRGRMASGQPPRGRITAVSASYITIQSRAGGPKTFSIAADAVVTLDGQPSSVSLLQVGQRAAITSADGTTATEIKVRTRRPGGRRFGGGPPNNASPASPPPSTPQ